MSPIPYNRRSVRALDRRASSWIRRMRAQNRPAIHTEHLVLRSTVGYQIDTTLHYRVRQASDPPLPAVVLCPGIATDSSTFAGWKGPLHADEVARLGALVLRFDPAGRGSSWGDEDYSGPEHQDNVACAVAYLQGRPEVDPARIGLVGISLGVAMAVGAVVLRQAPAAWVLDWEGPCDREIITASGTIMAPADGHGMDDEVYWQPREAVRLVGQLDCPYVRLQAEFDHAQPGETRHATRMIQAAAAGDRSSWFQINNHPRNTVPPRPTWLASGRLGTNQVLLRKIRMLLQERREPPARAKTQGD